MKFQHDKSWEAFTTIFNLKVSARQAWTKLIEFHEQNFLKPYWIPLKETEIEEEQTNIINWLTDVVTKKSSGKNKFAPTNVTPKTFSVTFYFYWAFCNTTHSRIGHR